MGEAHLTGIHPPRQDERASYIGVYAAKLTANDLGARRGEAESRAPSRGRVFVHVRHVHCLADSSGWNNGAGYTLLVVFHWLQESARAWDPAATVLCRARGYVCAGLPSVVVLGGIVLEAWARAGDLKRQRSVLEVSYPWRPWIHIL